MIVNYNREDAVSYARKWALSRNPKYYNFDALGGDCTNFISQCVYAGSKIMNYSPNGWYYNSLNDRAPAWSGVEFFYDFLLNNIYNGPFAVSVNKFEINRGDVIVLERAGDLFHTLIVSDIISGSVLVCSHTRNALDLPLNAFSFTKAHYLHIQGVRK